MKVRFDARHYETVRRYADRVLDDETKMVNNRVIELNEQEFEDIKNDLSDIDFTIPEALNRGNQLTIRDLNDIEEYIKNIYEEETNMSYDDLSEDEKTEYYNAHYQEALDELGIDLDNYNPVLKDTRIYRNTNEESYEAYVDNRQFQDEGYEDENYGDGNIEY